MIALIRGPIGDVTNVIVREHAEHLVQLLQLKLQRGTERLLSGQTDRLSSVLHLPALVLEVACYQHI